MVTPNPFLPGAQLDPLDLDLALPTGLRIILRPRPTYRAQTATAPRSGGVDAWAQDARARVACLALPDGLCPTVAAAALRAECPETAPDAWSVLRAL